MVTDNTTTILVATMLPLNTVLVILKTVFDARGQNRINQKIDTATTAIDHVHTKICGEDNGNG